MADEQPGAPENPFHLQLEHVGIGIDAAVDATGFDQAPYGITASVWHGGILRNRRRGFVTACTTCRDTRSAALRRARKSKRRRQVQQKTFLARTRLRLRPTRRLRGS